MREGAPAHPESDSAIVRDQLRRTLASRAFSDSPRASRFLSYVVEEALQGRAQNLKEYPIGIEVFDRGDSFDPRADTIVRVEASRLRNRLRQYYETEGVNDAVTIELPPGGYAPAFTKRASRRNRLATIMIAAVAVVAAGGIIAASIMWLQSKSLPAERSVAVLPFQNVGDKPENQALCDGVFEILTSRLSEQEQFQGSFWVVNAADVRQSGIRSPAQAARTFGVALALTGSIQRSGDTVRSTLNLINARNGHPLDAKTIHLAHAEMYALEDKVEEAATAMLRLRMSGARRAMSANGTREPGAEDFYLQARGYLQRGPEMAETAAALFQRAIDQDARYAPAYAGLAEAYVQRYESTKESAWLNKAAAAAEMARKIEPELAAVYVAFGLINDARGRYNEAIRELGEALAHNPRSAETHYYLAKAYEDAGRLRDGEQVLKEVIDLRPDYWKGYDSMAKFYLRRGRNDEARHMFQRAVDLAPDNARALANLGAVNIRLRRVKEAEEELRKSLAIQPTYGAYNNLGTLYYQQRRYADAVPMLENAVRLGGGCSSVLVFGLAKAYLYTPGLASKAPEKYRDAMECAERELAVNPKDDDVRSRLAWLYAETKQPKKAIEQADKMLKDAPSNVDVLLKCILAYELSGKRTRALEVFAAAKTNGYNIAEVWNYPELAGLRGDQRFVALAQGGAQP